MIFNSEEKNTSNYLREKHIKVAIVKYANQIMLFLTVLKIYFLDKLNKLVLVKA